MLTCPKPLHEDDLVFRLAFLAGLARGPLMEEARSLPPQFTEEVDGRLFDRRILGVIVGGGGRGHPYAAFRLIMFVYPRQQSYRQFFSPLTQMLTRPVQVSSLNTMLLSPVSVSSYLFPTKPSAMSAAANTIAMDRNLWSDI